MPEVAANSAAVRTEGNSPCFDFDELRGIFIYRSKHAKPRAFFKPIQRIPYHSIFRGLILSSGLVWTILDNIYMLIYAIRDFPNAPVVLKLPCLSQT